MPIIQHFAALTPIPWHLHSFWSLFLIVPWALVSSWYRCPIHGWEFSILWPVNVIYINFCLLQKVLWSRLIAALIYVLNQIFRRKSKISTWLKLVDYPSIRAYDLLRPNFDQVYNSRQKFSAVKQVSNLVRKLMVTPKSLCFYCTMDKLIFHNYYYNIQVSLLG